MRLSLLLAALSACSSPDLTDAADPQMQNLILAAHDVPAVRAVFGLSADVRVRPARGRGSEALRDAVSRATARVAGVSMVDYAEMVGYVVLGVVDAVSVREAFAAPAAAGVSADEVAVQIESRVVALPG